MSKEEAAVRCRFTKENLEYYEGGRNKVRVAQLEKWAEVYRVPVPRLALYLAGCARLEDPIRDEHDWYFSSS